ncbi:hypothetical protein CC1G_02121 [Coprinopsis cinerea okayama7|uniref:F-box domain-containing protein n=1 Tax=Coprinopsis cinerea (strain Okayama-7 / 130 / ATCC MYA-4618 / FGSC 9003) TaxID=240176 RepID=A8NK95_COPC7|nr:hypothetical protein CC1G_02121 [Coprinopsis cinerea okayama7\|eukprot:XP_001834385.2 hypothetical protein CC1G_02121 [Coprinopsis cinerea okayama7\
MIKDQIERSASMLHEVILVDSLVGTDDASGSAFPALVDAVLAYSNRIQSLTIASNVLSTDRRQRKNVWSGATYSFPNLVEFRLSLPDWPADTNKALYDMVCTNAPKLVKIDLGSEPTWSAHIFGNIHSPLDRQATPWQRLTSFKGPFSDPHFFFTVMARCPQLRELEVTGSGLNPKINKWSVELVHRQLQSLVLVLDKKSTGFSVPLDLLNLRGLEKLTIIRTPGAESKVSHIEFARSLRGLGDRSGCKLKTFHWSVPLDGNIDPSVYQHPMFHGAKEYRPTTANVPATTRAHGRERALSRL